jgi:hypothetical protein
VNKQSVTFVVQPFYTAVIRNGTSYVLKELTPSDSNYDFLTAGTYYFSMGANRYSNIVLKYWRGYIDEYPPYAQLIKAKSLTTVTDQSIYIDLDDLEARYQKATGLSLNVSNKSLRIYRTNTRVDFVYQVPYNVE